VPLTAPDPSPHELRRRSQAEIKAVLNHPVCSRASARPTTAPVRQRPFNSDFEVEVFEKTIAVRFWPTRSLYTFARFTTEREIADFGLVSPDPVIQHGSRSGRTRQFDAAEVLAMAFRLALAAVRMG
jgi:hypothetical protein